MTSTRLIIVISNCLDSNRISCFLEVSMPANHRRHRRHSLSHGLRRRMDRSAVRFAAESRSAGLDGRGGAGTDLPLHGPRRHVDRHAEGGHAAVERPAAAGRPGQARARALRRREPRPGGAVGLAGHDRPDLSGRQPPGLRRRARRGHLPRAHRVQQRSGGRPLAGGRRFDGPRGPAARRLQSAGRQEPRSAMDPPPGPIGQGLLRARSLPATSRAWRPR